MDDLTLGCFAPLARFMAGVGGATCVAAAPTVAAARFAAFAAFEFFSAFTGLTALSALAACVSLASLMMLAALAGCLAFARLPGVDGAVPTAERAFAAVVSATAALGDAMLRRAGRADPEDVTMGFLREARVC
ncbi:hypothetical protein AAGS40_03765 [Paraburkholderia sp. PREW-6R]|uniref:hypothetical protein n=1 Tax=Paraburkholderia sp. PREW-6R TaxID=3141544 RepID=UPI0031F5CE61